MSDLPVEQEIIPKKAPRPRKGRQGMTVKQKEARLENLRKGREMRRAKLQQSHQGEEDDESSDDEEEGDLEELVLSKRSRKKKEKKEPKPEPEPKADPNSKRVDLLEKAITIMMMKDMKAKKKKSKPPVHVPLPSPAVAKPLDLIELMKRRVMM